MRCVFLTGATGFVGAHVAQALAGQGWRVRVLARDVSRAAELAAAGAEVVAGDLSVKTDLATACRGCEAIVHAAGLLKARSLAEYREVNAAGTERLLRAASRSAPDALFVLVSSQAAAGPARDGRPVTEGDAANPVSWYGLSKREGELAVARLWSGAWIVLRPGVIYGPGDRGLLVLFRAAARGFLPVAGGGRRIQLIEAGDAALAIARAAERRDLFGRTGFLVAPEPITMEGFCRKLARLPSKRPLIVPIPDAAVRAAAWLESLAEAITGRSMLFNADKAREILAGDWLCDGAPMRADLDLPPPTPLEQGLRRAWDWYRDRGWLGL